MKRKFAFALSAIAVAGIALSAVGVAEVLFRLFSNLSSFSPQPRIWRPQYYSPSPTTTPPSPTTTPPSLTTIPPSLTTIPPSLTTTPPEPTVVEPGYYSTPDGDWLKATENSLCLGEGGGATYARLENKINANLTDPEDDVELQYRIKKVGHGRYLLVRESKGSFPKMEQLFSFDEN